MSPINSAPRWLFFILVCVSISGLMPACMDDDVNAVLPEDDEGLFDAYIQLNITLPNSTSTRAEGSDTQTTDLTLDIDPTEPATEAESAVKTLHLYLFLADGTPHADNPFTPTVLKAHTTENEEVCYQSQVLKVRGQTTYHAYLLVNPTATYAGRTEAAFMDETAAFTAVGTPTSITTRGVPMSARSNTAPYIYLEVTPSADNTPINPAQLYFTVERSWAKVTLSTTNEYPLYVSTDEADDPTPLGRVTLLSYRFMNIPATYYLFRHVGRLDTPNDLQSGFGGYYSTQATDATGKLTETNVYVCDPYSTQKTFTTGSGGRLTCPSAAYLTAYAVGSSPGFTPLTVDAGGGNTLLGYLPENVMAYGNQKKGYATGLVFQAQLTPTKVYGRKVEGADGDTLFYYQPARRFYYSMNDLIRDNALTDITPAIQQSAERRNRFGIYCYAEGLCYYPYYLRLFTPEERVGGHLMQAMEFAVVRNNEYRLGITRIALRTAEGLGIDATEDVLLNEVYLTTTVDVAPWILCSERMTLGGF